MKKKLAFLLVALLVSAGLLILVGNAVADTGTSTKAAPEEEWNKLWNSSDDIDGDNDGWKEILAGGSTEAYHGNLYIFALADEHPLIAIGELYYSGPRKLARTSDGVLHSVYSRSNGSYSQIYHSYSSDGGKNWTEEQITNASQNHRYPSLAIDSNNSIHVAWSYCQEPSYWGKTCTIQYRVKTTTWQPIENVITNYGATTSIAVDSKNNVHLVISGYWGGAYNCDDAKYMKRTASGWGTVEKVSTQCWGSQPVIAIDKNDNIHVVYNNAPLPCPYYGLRYRNKTSSGWGGEVVFEANDASGGECVPSIAVDSNNYVHVVWAWKNPNKNEWAIKFRRFTDSWQPTEILEGPTSYPQSYPVISVDSNDNLYVVWQGKHSGSPDYYQIRHREYNGSWSAIENLTSASLDQRNPNLIWAWWPSVNDLGTNIPKSGYAFIWNDNETIRFYKSTDLAWETPTENHPPNPPLNLAQLKSDGTEIPEGKIINESTVIFKGTVSDPDGDNVRLEIELRRIEEPFTGEPTPETISGFVPNGTEVTITRYGLITGAYHWQYRAKDSRGATSAWKEFGAPRNVDFSILAECGLDIDLASEVPEGYYVNKPIRIKVTVTNPTNRTGVNLNAYNVNLTLIEPKNKEIEFEKTRATVGDIAPGGSKTAYFNGTMLKPGVNVEVIVNAEGDADLGKIRGDHRYTITIHDPEVPKPDWSFAIIADPHIGYDIPNFAPNSPLYICKDGLAGRWCDNLTGGPEEDYYITEYLRNAVDKIIAEKDNNIKFVVILGDFADTAERSEFLKAREILNRLNDPDKDPTTDDGIPYIPVIGDHDQWPYIQREKDGRVDPSPEDRPESVKEKADYAYGDEFFNEIFWSEDNNINLKLIEERLGVRLSEVGSTSIPGRSQPAYLQNRAFSYGNINFVCLDFNPRITPPDADWWRIAEDIARDYGGALIAAPHQQTMDFLKGFLMDNRGKRTITFTHHPLWERGGFLFPGDIAKIIYDNECHGKTYNFGGHTHRNWPKPGEVGGHIVPYIKMVDTFPEYSIEAYEVIETEAVSQIPCEFPEWILKKEEWKYDEITSKVIRIVRIKGDEINYTEVLKPSKEIDMLWPSPHYTYGPFASYPEPNKEIFFTAQFTPYYGYNTSFDWDFGDGTNASGFSVSHIYQQEGEYNVTLTVNITNLVTGEGRNYTVTRPVYVHNKHIISSLPSELNITS